MKKRGLHIHILVFVLGLTFNSQNLFAQIFVNNGAQVIVQDNALVGIHGSMQNGTASGPAGSTFDNDGGYVWIDGDCINLNTHTIAGSDVGGTSGTYVVKGNWDNSGLFNAFQSTVELDSSIEQLITGSSITTFNNLALKGSLPYNVKRQTIDAFIDASGSLQVNDAELATDNSLMQVLNTSNAAISHDDGFISSLGGAYVSWDMNSTSTYEFPVGSSLVTLRKREAVLTPASGAANTMGVRFANTSGTSEGYNLNLREQEVCEVKPEFYHRLYRLNGNDNMSIALRYIQPEDGSWNVMANWENSPAREWSQTESSSVASSFMVAPDWSSFVDTAFAFARLLDDLVLTATPNSICPGFSSQLSITGLSGPADITWIQPIDPTLPSGPITLPLTGIVVTPDQTTIYEAVVTVDGCPTTVIDTVVVETPAVLSITVMPNPAFACEGFPLEFFADTSGGGSTGVIQWILNGIAVPGQNADTFYLASASQGDMIRATYTTTGGCSGEVSSDVVTVTTSSSISAEITGEDLICVPQDQAIPLFVTITKPDDVDVDIEWYSDAELSCYNGCTGTFATPILDDSVYVYVSVSPRGNDGCPIIDSVLICAINIPDLYVPSAFTPDGDSDNDVLAILGDIDEFDLQLFRIFNRWGELLFETSDFSQGWDGTYKGTEQELDAYSYYMEATHVESGEKRDKKGMIILIR